MSDLVPRLNAEKRSREKTRRQVQHLLDQILDTPTTYAPAPSRPKKSKTARNHRHPLLQLLVARDGNACYLCRTELQPEQMRVEHIIPVIHGGTDDHYNLAIACRDCNYEKSDSFVSIVALSAAPCYHR